MTKIGQYDYQKGPRPSFLKSPTQTIAPDKMFSETFHFPQKKNFPDALERQFLKNFSLRGGG